MYATIPDGSPLIARQDSTIASRFFRLSGLAGSRLNRIAQHYGLRITGPTGSHWAIEYVERRTGWTNWLALAHVTVSTSGEMFVDRQSNWVNQRVYRVTRLQ